MTENPLTLKLEETDQELFSLINGEFDRQKNGIELIASENYASLPVIECLGSCLTNKYSEGQIGRRYYGGNEYIDKIETLCKSRALQLYSLDNNEWHVNVQPYSGSPANMAVYLALLNPHDRIMGLDLPSGGHLTHGFYTNKKRISASSIFFESLPYYINDKDLINYEDLEITVKRYKPKLLICGASAYPRDIDYQKFRTIADSVGAILMCDMAHISGLVAAHNYHNLFPEMNNPFEWCDVVTTTTHKTLGGPRSGMIFIRKNMEKYGIENSVQAIDDAVFPGLQGGPHNHQIAGLAYQLKYAMYPRFKTYIENVVHNSRHLANELSKRDFEISSNGTDNHIVLVKLRNKGLSGSKMEYLCELCDISINKNSVYGDKNPMNPTGIRLGTSAMTTRGFGENEFTFIADKLTELVQLGVQLQEKYGKKLKDFKEGIKKDLDNINDIIRIKNEVNEIAAEFPFY